MNINVNIPITLCSIVKSRVNPFMEATHPKEGWGGVNNFA